MASRQHPMNMISEPKEQADTPAESVTSNQQSNLTHVGKKCTSCLDLQDEVTQLREALQRISIPTADQIPASEFEFIIPKEEHELVKDAMDKSKSEIFVIYDE